MATNMTIKRYNGTSWVEYAPATTIGQVSGLQTALNGKQATLTFDSAPTQSSSNPVTSGGIYTAIGDVRNIAYGRTTTHSTHLFSKESKKWLCGGSNDLTNTTITSSTSGVTFFEVAQDEDTVNITTKYLYLLSNTSKVEKCIELGATGGFQQGDSLYIVDLNYPDFWLAYGSTNNSTYNWTISRLETEKPPLENYVPTSRTINGKALTTDITLSASDVSALPSSTTYLVSANANGNTLTIAPSSGSAITYTPTIPTNYLSDTPTSSTSKTYLIGKSGTGASSTNNYNSSVYMTNGKLYATSFEASNALYLSSGSSPSAEGLSNVSDALYWKSTKVVTGNYIKSVSSSNNVLTLTKQDDSTTTFTNNTSYIGSSTPSNAHNGDIWFVTA